MPITTFYAANALLRAASPSEWIQKYKRYGPSSKLVFLCNRTLSNDKILGTSLFGTLLLQNIGSHIIPPRHISMSLDHGLMCSKEKCYELTILVHLHKKKNPKKNHNLAYHTVSDLKNLGAIFGVGYLRLDRITRAGKLPPCISPRHALPTL
jgi:hypothetical protein